MRPPPPPPRGVSSISADTTATLGVEADAAAARSFCDFLEMRVLTRNLPLLRRMVHEYFRGDGHNRTVHDFVALGATLIVIKPFDVHDGEQRREAAELLERQREQTAALEATTSLATPAVPWRSVRERERRCCAWLRHLNSRLRTRNLPWLSEMLAQFLVGQEESLVAFVHAGTHVVSFLPVEARASDVGGASGAPAISVAHGGSSDDPINLVDDEAGPIRKPAQEEEEPQRSKAAAQQKKRSRTDIAPNDKGHEESSQPRNSSGDKRRQSRYNNGDDSESFSEEDTEESSESSDDLSDSDSGYDEWRNDRERPAKAARRTHRESSGDVDYHEDTDDASSSDERLRQMQLEVLAAFNEVEARKPWELAFHDQLELPFDENTYPDLAESVRRFWAVHSRAVWERNFWAPYSLKFEVRRLKARKARQKLAAHSFQSTVAEPAAQEFGSSFFVELDRCVPRAEGWWYRNKVVDLLTMYRESNDVQVVHRYLDSQATKRFPHSGKLGRRYRYNGNGVSASMWSRSKALQTVVMEIRRMKQHPAASNIEGNGDESYSVE